MSKENDKIFRTLEHIAITFDKLGYSPTIPIFKGHQDFEWLFKLELDTIKALCNQQDQKIADLEAKLEESEEKINMLEEHKFYADNIIQAYADKCKKADQDKISFALEQLEKVKELILKECFEVSGGGVVVRYYAIYHIFDNQIKQLKEGK